MKYFILFFIALMLSSCATTKLSVTGGNFEKKALDSKVIFAFNKQHNALPIISVSQEVGLSFGVRPTYFQIEWKIENIW